MFCEFNADKVKCYNFKHKASNFCKTHNKPSDNKDNKYDNISVFNDKHHKWYLCQCKNKYGEFICNNNYQDSFNKKRYNENHFNLMNNKNNWCNDHSLFCKMFYIKFDEMLDEYHNTLNINSINVCIEHLQKMSHMLIENKEMIICYNMTNLVTIMNEIITNMKKYLHDNKLQTENNIKIMKTMKSNVEHLHAKTQIQMNRSLLISNMIKIKKISQINAVIIDRILPVIVKGIDDIILKYIVSE